jgi:predicted RNA-binding Zn-ribbon protein involved in translation (DUF1610 family)
LTEKYTNNCIQCGSDISGRLWNATKCHTCVIKNKNETFKKYQLMKRHNKIEHVVAYHCIDCNCVVSVKHNPHGFYCDRCKDIRRKAMIHRSRLNTNSSLGSHRNKDFYVEEELIQREIRKLKLRMWRRYKTDGQVI